MSRVLFIAVTAMNLCRFHIASFMATNQSSVRSQSEEPKPDGKEFSLDALQSTDKFTRIGKVVSCIKLSAVKLCLLYGNFSTWMVDVLLQTFCSMQGPA